MSRAVLEPGAPSERAPGAGSRPAWAGTLGPDAAAGDVVRAVLRPLVVHLRSLELPLRAGDDEAVHDARTVTRRLRTVASVGRPALEADAARAVGSALRELGHALGAVRDPTVEARALRRDLADQPAGFAGGPADRLAADRDAARTAALADLVRLLDSPRHARLVDALDALDAAPGGPQADREATAPLLARCRREWRRFARAMAVADAATPGAALDEALHRARKAARRARYATELAAYRDPVAAARSARRAAAVQDALGVQHDTVVRRATLRRVAARAQLDGEDDFVYGRLDALAQREGERAHDDARRAGRRALRPGHRRWMR